jgi:hypothetical protein
VPEPSPSLVVGGSEHEPVVFSGPPDELTARIDIHNPSKAKVVLRDAGLRDPTGALRLPTARHALEPVVLRPDQGGSVPLSIAVDPTTPPGEHAAELDLGGRTQTVVLHVAEVLDLTVTPDELVVVNSPGIAQKKRVVVTNDGNVPFTIADPGPAVLRDDLPADRVRRVAIEPLPGREEPDLEALVVAVLAVVREEERGRGRVVVTTVGGEVQLQPGETKPVDLEITLQDELPVGGRYRARIPILTQNVDVVVVTSGGPVMGGGGEEAPKRPSRRTTDTDKPKRRRARPQRAPRGGAKS